MRIIVLFVLFNLLIAQDKTYFDQIDNPTAIYIHKDLLYIVDGKTDINIFNLNDYKFLKKFGKEGKSKGEFLIRPDHNVSLSFNNDEILVNSDKKVSFFSNLGDFIKEDELKSWSFSYQYIIDRYVALASLKESDKRYFVHNLYDQNLSFIKELNRMDNDYQPGEGLKAFSVAWQFYIYEDEIFIHNKEKGAVIDVYGFDGNLRRNIKWDYEPVKVQKKHIEGVLNHYRKSAYTKNEFDEIKNLLKFPEYFSACRSWFVNDHKIYVFSYQTVNEKSQMLTFDLNGKLLKETFVPFYQKGTDIDRVFPFCIHKDKLYQLIKENKTVLLVTELE